MNARQPDQRLLIRRALPEDARTIAEVDVASWRAAYRELMPPEYLASLSSDEKASSWALDIATLGAERRKRWLVAEVDGSIAGYSLAGVPTGSERGMLYLLYTLPETWGTGPGPALHTAAMVSFADLGVHEATLWVLEANGRARRFYEREGWTPTGETSEENYGETTLRALEYRLPVLQTPIT